MAVDLPVCAVGLFCQGTGPCGPPSCLLRPQAGEVPLGVGAWHLDEEQVNKQH